MYPIVTMTITWILVIARFIIAVQLTRVARRQKLPNLLWLAAFFYITGIGDIFLTISPVTSLLWPFFLAVGLSELVLVMFIQKTFYQDRKSPFLVFLVIALAILVADMRFAVYTPYYSPFNWLWLIWVGYKAYQRVAADRLVEDWVKARYKLVIAYSLVALAAPFFTVLSLIAMVVPSFAAVLYLPTVLLAFQIGILVFVTIGIVLEYLAWVMPERYQVWLNRNYQSPVLDEAEMNLSAEDLKNKLKSQS